MSNKLKKSHVRESKDFSASIATASEQGANQQDLADEKTVDGEAAEIYEQRAETDNVIKVHARSGTDKKSGTSHESPVNAQEELTPDSFPQSIKIKIERLRTVIDRIDSGFRQARELIAEIARE